jgi:hypothetical protein
MSAYVVMKRGGRIKAPFTPSKYHTFSTLRHRIPKRQAMYFRSSNGRLSFFACLGVQKLAIQVDEKANKHCSIEQPRS